MKNILTHAICLFLPCANTLSLYQHSGLKLFWCKPRLLDFTDLQYLKKHFLTFKQLYNNISWEFFRIVPLTYYEFNEKWKGIRTFTKTIRNLDLLNNFEKFKYNVRRIRSAPRRAQLCTFLLFILTNEQRKSYEVLWGWVHTSQVGLQKADIVCKYLGTRTYVDRTDRILELDIFFWSTFSNENTFRHWETMFCNISSQT